MNSNLTPDAILLTASPATQDAAHVEFFRIPSPGKRDPHFGLSRAWYYKAEALGLIRMVSLRQRGATRGIRLISYDSVVGYIRQAMTCDTPRVH